MRHRTGSIRIEEIVLDPEFWKALAEAEHWEEKWKVSAAVSMFEAVWIYEMHRMLDMLAAGKSISDYFQTL